MGATTNIPKPGPGMYLAKRNGTYNLFRDLPGDIKFYTTKGWQKIDYHQEVARLAPNVPPPAPPPVKATSAPTPAPDPSEGVIDIDNLTIKDLRELAVNVGVDPSLKGSDLREAMREAYGKNLNP